jgi:hypothetical protein
LILLIFFSCWCRLSFQYHDLFLSPSLKAKIKWPAAT